jgi:hypothetical protein
MVNYVKNELLCRGIQILNVDISDLSRPRYYLSKYFHKVVCKMSWSSKEQTWL